MGGFDIFSIIFLVIAVLIFMRLNSVLGRRTGNEPTPGERPVKRDAPGRVAEGAAREDNNVINLPGRSENARAARREPDLDLIRRHAKDGTPAFEGLKRIMAADPNFDPTGFMEGARAAYEMIVQAFAEGDRKALKPLLAPDVYASFVDAIEAREARGEAVESTFVGIDSATIENAELDGRAARVTVGFDAEVISATRDSEGEVVSGDPNDVQTLRDEWTFARRVDARDPNWQLVAT